MGYDRELVYMRNCMWPWYDPGEAYKYVKSCMPGIEWDEVKAVETHFISWMFTHFSEQKYDTLVELKNIGYLGIRHLLVTARIKKKRLNLKNDVQNYTKS